MDGRSTTRPTDETLQEGSEVGDVWGCCRAVDERRRDDDRRSTLACVCRTLAQRDVKMLTNSEAMPRSIARRAAAELVTCAINLRGNP